MSYHEQSFLEGLACGLTATAANHVGASAKTHIVGTGNWRDDYPPYMLDTDGAQHECVFTYWGSWVEIQTPFPVTFLYEYGPKDEGDDESFSRVTPYKGYFDGTKQLAFRRVAASRDVQRISHVVQIPSPRSMERYCYNVWMLEPAYQPKGTEIHFDGGFISYPCYEKDTHLYVPYPGSPEAMVHWWSRNVR